MQSKVGRLSSKRLGLISEIVLSVALGLLLVGCSSGRHSFLVAQTCLGDANGIEAFMKEMQDIGIAENMTFVDHSRAVAQQLNEVGYSGLERTHGSQVIDVSVQRPDGVGVTATNVGLPGFEIALGFSEGSDREFAHAFANRVLARLGARWRLVIVPSGTGAKPKGDCP
jgi:hypothetical protein